MPTLVDATIIASASEDDTEGHWIKHKGKPAGHGVKAHVGANAEPLWSRRSRSRPGLDRGRCDTSAR